MNDVLIKKINISSDLQKKVSLLAVDYYDALEIYSNKVVGIQNGVPTETWFFKDYANVNYINATLSVPFAQIHFVSGDLSGVVIAPSANEVVINDRNRIKFSSGMINVKKANEFVRSVYTEIKTAYENYKDAYTKSAATTATATPAAPALSSADEILKYKNLLDMGVITQEEFDAKKKELLGL